ncbi:MAG TPA: FeoB-associated Cys-rich membrane protein [Pyrinomonadaceae bacterium]|jgi:hypothetical protein|nr:FeoB-associated Cys-rich membrane protein [Pyrinomonadaceae bacterium]
MKFDWQTVAVVLIVLAALFYVGRMLARRLRSMRARGGDIVAGGDCSGCSAGEVKSTAPAPKVLVQIGRGRATPPRR